MEEKTYCGTWCRVTLVRETLGKPGRKCSISGVGLTGWFFSWCVSGWGGGLSGGKLRIVGPGALGQRTWRGQRGGLWSIGGVKLAKVC